MLGAVVRAAVVVIDVSPPPVCGITVPGAPPPIPLAVVVAGSDPTTVPETVIDPTTPPDPVVAQPQTVMVKANALAHSS